MTTGDDPWWKSRDLKIGLVLAVAGGVIALFVAFLKPEDSPPLSGSAAQSNGSHSEPTQAPTGGSVDPKPSDGPTDATSPSTDAPDDAKGVTESPSSPYGALDSFMTDVEDIKVGDRNDLDVDARVVAEEKEVHPGFEVNLSMARLFPLNSRSLGIIDNKDVPRCASRALVKSGYLDLSDVSTEQSVCMKTDRGRWALLQVVDYEDGPGIGVGSVTFRVGFLKDPS